MLSRIIPLEYLKERDLMFWLPPGGQDNEVWADTWVILAELESAHAEPVLDLLRDNDIGAYVARPNGLKGATSSIRQLYVDREQHNLATDVVMQFLRGKDHQAAPVPRKRVAPPAAPEVKPPAIRVLSIVLQVVFITGLIALGLLLAYYRGPSMFPGVHPAPHPTSVPNTPGMTAPTWTVVPRP
jgi:hypothetical protein